GDSMAVPHVSGAVALLLAEGLGRDAAVQRIVASAARISCGAGCHGRLNVAAATALAPPPAPPAAAPSSPSPALRTVERDVAPPATPPLSPPPTAASATTATIPSTAATT